MAYEPVAAPPVAVGDRCVDLSGDLGHVRGVDGFGERYEVTGLGLLVDAELAEAARLPVGGW